MISKEALTEKSYQHPILLFDGDCILCSRFVRWILRHDKKEAFRFASLQQVDINQTSDVSKIDTVLLLHNGIFLEQSDVTFEVLKILGGRWKWWLPLRWIPTSVRNVIYRWVASNRYSWFGKKENCLVPGPELTSRFMI